MKAKAVKPEAVAAKNKPKTAAELIAARSVPALADPPAAALKELKELLEYNDGQSSPNRRIGSTEAVTMLRTHGWQGAGRTALDSLCVRVFGRGSYGTA